MFNEFRRFFVLVFVFGRHRRVFERAGLLIFCIWILNNISIGKVEINLQQDYQLLLLF